MHFVFSLLSQVQHIEDLFFTYIYLRQVLICDIMSIYFRNTLAMIQKTAPLYAIMKNGRGCQKGFARSVQWTAIQKTWNKSLEIGRICKGVAYKTFFWQFWALFVQRNNLGYGDCSIKSNVRRSSTSVIDKKKRYTILIMLTKTRELGMCVAQTSHTFLRTF